MARIVVVGTVATDEAVRLTSPLRRGVHLEGLAQAPRLGGGAANTALPLAHAGNRVSVVSAVGDDAAGPALVAELARAGVDVGPVRVIGGAATTRSILLVEDGGERTVVNLGRTAEPGPPRRILEIQADVIYVRSRELDLAEIMTEAARRALVVAHMPPVEAASRPAHVLVASESDLGTDALTDPWALGRTVAGPLLEWVVITRGPKGAKAFGADGCLEVAVAPAEVADSTGAGDAFAAGLAHALGQGLPMPEALETAAAWGRESVRWEASALPKQAVARLLGETG